MKNIKYKNKADIGSYRFGINLAKDQLNLIKFAAKNIESAERVANERLKGVNIKDKRCKFAKRLHEVAKSFKNQKSHFFKKAVKTDNKVSLFILDLSWIWIKNMKHPKIGYGVYR